jgi:hypothetical protein
MNYLNSLESSLNPLFTNKYFLYTIVFLSATSNLGYLLANNINAVGFFIIVGIIMVNFSKNMAVVLTVCLVATNFLVATKTREGMENPLTPEEEEDEDKEGFEGGNDEDEDEELKEGFEGGNDEDEDEVEGFGFNKKNSPKLDYGQSATNAYNDLDNILDPEAIDKLTKETMELMEQQKTLYTSMQSMAPLLSQANSLLKGFDMSKLEGLASGATSLSEGDGASAVAGVDMSQLKTLAEDMEKLKGTTSSKGAGKKEAFTTLSTPSFFRQIADILKR